MLPSSSGSRRTKSADFVDCFGPQTSLDRLPRLARPRAREKELESSLTAAATSSTFTILTSLSSLLFTSLTPGGLLNHESGNETLAAAMSEAGFRVESGALGPQENFLPLGRHSDVHEKLSVRTEELFYAAPGRFLPRPERRGRDRQCDPEVSDSVWKDYNSK